MPQIGQQFSQYRIVSPLGSGGMGEVYLAEDIQLHRKAALKFLSPEFSSNPDALERFIREARAASALNHPSICTIYEINSRDELPFIAMEFIEGETVSAMIRRRRRNIRQTIDIAIQVSSALVEAHGAGIVHRDVKPANIILTNRGRAKILDFGLVKLVESEHFAAGGKPFLTKAGMIVGTASYMSPEQARGLEVDGRTDVWSLGVVLYEMLTGSLPFSGETSTDTLAAILTKTPVPPSQLCPEIPADLERVILTALSSNREERYSSASKLLTDLQELNRRMEFEAELQRSAALRNNDEQTFIFDNAPTEVAVRNTTGPDAGATGTRRISNLRTYMSPIIGRRSEISAITHLLRDEQVRLVTMTGIGGTGKTRLAHAVAETMLHEFPDGVFMIELSSVTLPELVAASIAQPLGVKDAGGRPVIDILKDFLTDKRLLLVLDNFEQIVDAAPQVAEILAAAPLVKVLVTSRFLLRITAEREFVVPPLSPPPHEALALEKLKSNEAVRLFEERAQAANRSFELTEQNIQSVAAICSRLEGLPLAIELAAARARVLSAEAILAKLDSRLRFLTGGPRDLPERQRTMQAAIDWSYDLLDEDEKTAFRRLSVFAASFTAEAAEAVCDGADTLVIDLLISLLDKSLLQQIDVDGEEYRFAMLEVVREYAAAVLESAGEAGAISRKHAEYFVGLGEKAEPFLQAAHSAEWLDRLEDEHENIRTAMQWSLANDSRMSVRLAVAVRNFWILHSHLGEGYKWLKAALESGGDPPPELRFKLMNGLGLAARFRGDYETARKAYTDGLAAGREAGDKQGVALSSRGLGLVAMQQGDTAGARGYFESGLEISRELDDKFGISISLSFLGDLARTERDFVRARPLFEESLGLFRQLDNKSAVSDALNNLGATCFGEGEYLLAKKYFAEAANIALELGNKMTISHSIDGFAAIVLESGDDLRAAQLCGVAESLRESIGYKIEPAEAVFRTAYMEKLRERIADEDFTDAFERGRSFTPDAALDLALETSRAFHAAAFETPRGGEGILRVR